MALQRRETGFTTLKEWRASGFVYQHVLVLLLSYKTTQNIQELLIMDEYSLEICRNESATL